MFDCPEENAHRGEEDIAAVVRKSPFGGKWHFYVIYASISEHFGWHPWDRRINR